jgi:hypothetical protein
MAELLELEPTFNESSEAPAEVIEPPKKEFLIEEHGVEWRNIWESWPEEDRNHLIPYITGNLDAETYNNRGFSVQKAARDKTMSEEYAYFGLNDRNVAAEGHPSGQLTLYPELNKYSDEMQVHIVGHEMGHALGAHLIDPHEFKQRIAHRLSEEYKWSNGKYIQEIRANLANDEDGKPLDGITPNELINKMLADTEGRNPELQNAYRWLHEIMADDIADYLRAESPEEMLASRLERAGTEKDLKEKNPEKYEELLQDAEQHFAYLAIMLDPARQNDPKTRLNKSMVPQWFEELEMVDMANYIHETPMDIATPQYAPTKKRGQKQKGKGFFSWFFGLLG